jgi:hypothetical protein
MPEKVIPTLPGLPREVMDQIASELYDEDVAALHAVNQDLRNMTKYTYAKRFFTHVHVFLHPISFDKLRILSDDPIYARHIEHVTISTYMLRSEKDRCKGSSKHTSLSNHFN